MAALYHRVHLPDAWLSRLEPRSDDFTVVDWDTPCAGRSSDRPEKSAMSGYADCLAGLISGSACGRRTWLTCPSAVTGSRTGTPYDKLLGLPSVHAPPMPVSPKRIV